MNEFTRISPLDSADCRDQISWVSEAVWPEFMLHDAVANAHWDGLFEIFGAYQFALRHSKSEKVAAIVNSVPIHWDGPVEDLPEEGWDWAMEKSFADQQAGLPANILCGLQISIAPHFQGRGLSSALVEMMRGLAGEQGLRKLIVPVRPTWKARYPLTEMQDYVRWTRDDGLPYDPWLRVHLRSGGRLVKVCARAMEIEGAVAEWERWTGLRFFESGKYVVEGALVPVEIDLSADRGRYVEPNVWIAHPVGRD